MIDKMQQCIQLNAFAEKDALRWQPPKSNGYENDLSRSRESLELRHLRYCRAAPDHPLRTIPARIGDRWSTAVLMALDRGPLRHKELRQWIARVSHKGNISQHVLTSKLRLLEREGLIMRYGVKPIGIEYALTPLGSSLFESIDRLLDWIGMHIEKISTSRSQARNAATNRQRKLDP